VAAFDLSLSGPFQVSGDVKQLSEYLATYLYLPRLRDKEVLLATIKAGVVTRDFFGYATGGNRRWEICGCDVGQPATGGLLR